MEVHADKTQGSKSVFVMVTDSKFKKNKMQTAKSTSMMHYYVTHEGMT